MAQAPDHITCSFCQAPAALASDLGGKLGGVVASAVIVVTEEKHRQCRLDANGNFHLLYDDGFRSYAQNWSRSSRRRRHKRR